MDLYESCENGNEERVVELLIHGEQWLGLSHTDQNPHHHHRVSVVASVRSFFESNNGSFRRQSSRHESAVGLAATAVASAAAAAKASSIAVAAKASASAGWTLSPLEMLRVRGTAGRTPLHAACLGGQVAIVKLLLGEPCDVFFTSRTKDEAMELLTPLWTEAENCNTSPLRMEIKPDTSDLNHEIHSEGPLVPVATIHFGPGRVIPPQDLLDGQRHVDDFGNTPLQCISCFGCGSTVAHIADSLEITKQLLLHGDQPNLPKYTTLWTPLHWSAYNGNHEQAAMLLNPKAFLPKDQHHLIGNTQRSAPLLVNRDQLFAVDVAGRRGLALREEMAMLQLKSGVLTLYEQWRLRLDHVRVLQLFTDEFLQHAGQLTRYLLDMNARLPPDPKRKRGFTITDALRYGQHLLYWMGCFGLVDHVKALLDLKLVIGDQCVHLKPLYVCSCEENKRQSVLHAVAVHGQQEIVRLLLRRILLDQEVLPSAGPTPLQKTPSLKANARVLPIASNTDPSKPNQLDVLAMETGWRNYRNETPLFLAVLHLQEHVVRVLYEFLTPASLAWELKHCNVEGSYIHHVASDATRALLGLDPPMSHTNQRLQCAEYVLLFDGRLKIRQFKESLIETLREESAISPSLIVTRAGKRKISTWRSTWSTIDYLVVGATDDVLVRHAQALQLKIKHRGSTLRSKYNAATPAVFEPFRSLQRQQVVLDIIQKNCHLKKHLTKGNLRAIFPLHDASGCKNIMRHWVYGTTTETIGSGTDVHVVTRPVHRIYQPFYDHSVKQFLTEKRTHQYEMLWPMLTYFGEKHAFYYAFMVFYSVWLLLIALPGLIVQCIWMLGPQTQFVSPLFAVIVSIWATLMVERWKRKRSEIQSNFGAFKRNRNEESPDFYGDFQVETVEKPIIDVKFPKSKQLLRIYCGIPVLLTMASLVIILFIAVKMQTTTSDVIQSILPWLPPTVVPYTIPLLNAISMLVLDSLYTRVALALTRWENYRTIWQYESMLATKLFWFKFLNAFLSLFWVAFVDKDAVALRKQLVIIMGVRQLWYTFMRNIAPMLIVRWRWWRNGFQFQLDHQTSSKSKRLVWFTREWYRMTTEPLNDQDTVPQLVLMQELMQPPDFLMGKQMETVLQFGYISMFVSVLPIAPLLALLSNVINTRLDVICCTQAKKRPPFESETEVSTFMSILEFMSFAAVTVNCAVLFFTTKDDLESLLHWMWLVGIEQQDTAQLYMQRLWTLLIIEHVVLGTKALISLTIEDAAGWVQNDEDQKDDEAASTSSQRSRVTTKRTPREDSNTPFKPTTETMMQTDAVIPQTNASTVLVASRGATTISQPQVMTERYAQALNERDDALERERQLQQQLEACLAKLQRQEQPSRASKERTNDSNDDELENPFDQSPMGDESLPPSKMQTTNETDGRRCLICFVLRHQTVRAMKRCLSCHRFFCLPCDELMHLDDLGVREPTHLRVNVPTDSAMDRTIAIPLPSAPTIDQHTLDTLDQLLTAYGKHERSDATGPIEALSIHDLILRCRHEDIPLVLRFLKNHKRRHKHRQREHRKRSSASDRRSHRPQHDQSIVSALPAK